MVENAAAMEGVVRRELAGLDPNTVMTVRGRGLFFAIVIKPTEGERSQHTPQCSYCPPPCSDRPLGNGCVCEDEGSRAADQIHP